MTSNLGAHYLLDEALEDVGYSEAKAHSKVMVAEKSIICCYHFQLSWCSSAWEDCSEGYGKYWKNG